jgi:hypothetical protein
MAAKRVHGLSFEEVRAAKYDHALGDEARLCKQLNDLQALLLTDKNAEAQALLESLIKKAGTRRKAFTHALEFVATQIGRGRVSEAREVVSDLRDGLFRSTSFAIECWSQYRRHFERRFPEVIRYREPLDVNLASYSTLIVELRSGSVAICRIELDRDTYEDARLTFTNLVPEHQQTRLEWSTAEAPTLRMLEHKAICIYLPKRGECVVKLLGRAGIIASLTAGKTRDGARRGLTGLACNLKISDSADFRARTGSI